MCGVDYASDGSVRKRFFSTLENKNHDEHFTKTGLGQTLKTLFVETENFLCRRSERHAGQPGRRGQPGRVCNSTSPCHDRLSIIILSKSRLKSVDSIEAWSRLQRDNSQTKLQMMKMIEMIIAPCMVCVCVCVCVRLQRYQAVWDGDAVDASVAPLG